MSAVSPLLAFSDVSSQTPYARAIKSLEESGLIEGYADGSYKPATRINRAEFSKIVALATMPGSVEMCQGPESDSPALSDVPRDAWFYPYICALRGANVVNGYPDGTFKPEREINFVEAAKILSLAYGQVIEPSWPDWYESYARALESSVAIPPSIGSLEQKITRGEMAEMMWRLAEEVTDQPAKGYLNVKYPEMKVNLAAAVPQRATSCADLRAFTEEASRSGGGFVDMMEGDVQGDSVMMRETSAMPPPAPLTGGSAGGGLGYSQTNIQVEGVDEGDIVKTDGTYLYIIRNQEVRIVRARPAGELQNLATIVIDDQSFSPSDLYIDNGKLTVIGSTWQDGGGSIRPMEGAAESMIWPGPWWGASFTTVRIYDVADHTNPKLQRTVSFEGDAVSTRRIANDLYVVMNQSPRYWGDPVPLSGVREKDIMPVVLDSARGVEAAPAAPCSDVMILPRVSSPSYLIVGVVPLDSPSAEVERTVVLGSGENVYASVENLYVAATDWRYVWDTAADLGSHQRTRLYRFAFTDDGVSFQAQGDVKGRILDQFSMDEHSGYFRIATTIDTEWLADNTQRLSGNELYVLNQSMEIVGSIEDIAPGEQIYSTRFIGDRAYMVTFRTIDPLFVIDVADPQNPRILGKLKIPGYSDYLHPYDENHILGFGKEAVESKDGSFAWQQGMKIALFDVSDVEHPVEKHHLTIGDRGTDSPLLSNHKALLFEKNRELLAFPVNVYKLSNEQKQTGDESSAWGDPVFQGAHVYTLTLKDGFTLRGTVTHYSEDDWLKSGYMAYGKDIERIVRLGDSLLTVSPWGVQSHTEDDVKKEGSMSFDVPISGGGGACPDENDPNVHYVSKDPNQCATVRFSCIEGTEAFSDMCGCGCKPGPS